MGRKQLVVLLAATAFITLAAMTIAAVNDHKLLSATAAGIFTLSCTTVGWLLNARPRLHPDHAQTARQLAATNAGLMAATFAWGGATILAAYYLTDLFWHHAWQYGLGMLLVAAGLAGYRQSLMRPESALAKPAMLRLAAFSSIALLAAALVGLVFLLISGKLQSTKPDWIANHVFLAGGLLVVVLSYLAARAQLTKHQ